MDVSAFILAMGAPQGGGKEGGGGGSTTLMFGMIAVMIAIMYFLIFRPQRQREAKRKAMLGQVKKADHVVTIGGVHGVVTAVKGDDVVVKVDEANNIKMTFTKSAIARIIDKSADEDSTER